MITELIAVVYLVLLSIIDIHYKGRDFGIIPSALTTFFIILMFYLNGLSSLFGLVAFALFGIMLYETKLYEGTQDLKVMAGLGCLISTVEHALILVALVVVLGTIYKLAIRPIAKEIVKQVPFIPVLAASYMIYLLINILT